MNSATIEVKPWIEDKQVRQISSPIKQADMLFKIDYVLISPIKFRLLNIEKLKLTYMMDSNDA